LFAGVFVLRLVREDPNDLVTLLYAFPIALVATQRGTAWGVGAAALALGLFGVWDVGWNSSGTSALGYLSRGATFFVLGGFVGMLADGLRAASEQSARFWELSNDLMSTAGFDGYFRRLNPAWEQTLGWTPEELHARPFVEFVHADDRARTEAEAAKLVGAGYETLTFENRYRCKDGSYRTLLWGAKSIPDEQLIYATARDITERDVAERAAKAARAEAERANQAKSEFLSRMSHELRTPLNAVIGFGQLLQLDEMDPRQSEAVEQILRAGRHLLELINEVLDISRIESGTMSVSLEPVHLGSVLADALSLIRPLADDADVRLTSTAAQCAGLHVRADQQRLKQVLINLLSNAVKYNRRGGEVTVHCTELPGGRVEVAVTDTGPGMSAGQLERLFEPFDRLGAEATDIAGTGLGLALSRGLIQAMDGTISAESQPGAGSTMRIQLEGAQEPGGHADDSAPVATHRAPQQERTIVYIEDNLSNLRLVERLLDRIPGVRLIPAMQGKIGIELVRQHQPHLILLDLHLPDLHGREVLERLKRDPATAEIPIVILSADATPAQFERLLAAGAAGYLTKPIDVRSLLDTLQSCVRPSPAR
jgi:PAS domain S-box-containing protein